MIIEENKNLEAQPAQQMGEDRSLEVPAGTEGDGTQGTDPLDLIDDPEALRAEAKKQRGIAHRLGKKEEEATAAPAVQPAPAAPVAPAAPAPGEYLSRKDFEKTNERQAIKQVTTIADHDDEATRATKAEIDANFNRVKIYYTPRHGRETPEDIKQDLLDAHALWKRNEGAKNPADPQGDAARVITSSPVIRPAGAPRAAAPAANEDDDPRFARAATPNKWYPKKSA